MMDRIFSYLQYKTHLGQTGTFLAVLNASQIKEQSIATISIKGVERDNMMNEAMACINRLDSALPASRIFENSALAPEIILSFLVCSSGQLLTILNHPLQHGGAMHAVYTLHTRPKTKKIRVSEKIYPGPDNAASEQIINAWMVSQSFL